VYVSVFLKPSGTSYRNDARRKRRSRPLKIISNRFSSYDLRMKSNYSQPLFSANHVP